MLANPGLQHRIERAWTQFRQARHKGYARQTHRNV